MIDVSIIIVNYNTKSITLDCLNSIYQQTEGIEFEVVLVDNASTDGSVIAFKEIFPKVNVIESDKNLGFGRANNLGVKSARGEFLFLLNSDTILIENSIKKLYDFFIENEKILNIGVLGCKLIDLNGNINNCGGRFPTVKNDFNEVSILIRKKIFNKKLKVKEQYNFTLQYFEIENVVGADMMIRKELFNKIDGFDPHFFMYYEESDLQMRLYKLNYRNYIFTETSIVHFEGLSTDKEKKISNAKRINNTKSRNYYFKKNDKKHYALHLIVDNILNITRIFRKNYTLVENWNFIKENIKSY